jgi:hypothetical protein
VMIVVVKASAVGAGEITNRRFRSASLNFTYVAVFWHMWRSLWPAGRMQFADSRSSARVVHKHIGLDTYTGGRCIL